jgi:hypothetical protein
VIEIVIICFKKHGTARRDKAQQKGLYRPFSLNFSGICGRKAIKKPPQEAMVIESGYARSTASATP